MAIIRQEINILDRLANASILNAGSQGTVQLDTTQYNGTITYYFEIVGFNTSATLDDTFTLRRDGTTTDDVTITIPKNTSTNTLFRSTTFTPPAGQTSYFCFSPNSAGGFAILKSARIVIIQNTGTDPITNTETQIEIGSNSSITALTDTALTNPKYWKYTSANWDGTITAYFESTFATGTSKSAATVTLQVADGTGDGFVNWSNVASSAVTTTSTTGARVRSGAITLTAGRNYRAVGKAGNSKSGLTVYNAKIIIDQVEGGYLGGNDASGLPVLGGSGASGVQQEIAVDFSLVNASTITGVVLRLKKSGSPSDIHNINLVSTLDGTNLASATLDPTTLTTSFVNTTITFTTPYSASASTTYYVQVSRTGARDATNFISLSCAAGGTGNGHERDNGTWGAAPNTYFQLTGITGITKLEPQYLLANTLLAAGTGFQSFFTTLDPTTTEWDDGSGSITYSAAADAANGSTSVVTIQKSDGSVTYATVSSPDNQGISTFSSVPAASTTLDVKATTNGGDVAAVRILAAYVFSAAAPATPNTTNFFMFMTNQR